MFRKFLVEQAHIEHIEDLALEGVEGLQVSLDYLEEFGKLLSGQESSLHVSRKMDGAPAIVAGVDPEDGRFFVATKSIFNKTPKIYKTTDDIDAHLSGELAGKMKIALAYLPKLGIRNIIQGDMLFTKSDLRQVNINGKALLTFHPNTIVYGVNEHSALAREIATAQIGIAWHTVYSGNISNLQPIYNQNIIKNLKKTPLVFSMGTEADLQVSGIPSEYQKILHVLKQDFAKLTPKTFTILLVPAFKQKTKTFINSLVRNNQSTDDPKLMMRLFMAYLNQFFESEKAKRSSEIGRNTVDQNKFQVLEKINQYKDELMIIFAIHINIQKLKKILLDNLQTNSEIHTYVKNVSGYFETEHEGFVVSDKSGNNPIKLIDRLEFSRANFSGDVIKGFSK